MSSTRLAELCAHAEAANARACGSCSSSCRSSRSRRSQQALDVVRRAVDRPEAGVLVDTLHLARSGGTPDDLARDRPATLLPYLQLADAPASSPGRSRGAARRGAARSAAAGRRACCRSQRCSIACLRVPVSVELRSRQLMDEFTRTRWNGRSSARSDSTRRSARGWSETPLRSVRRRSATDSARAALSAKASESAAARTASTSASGGHDAAPTDSETGVSVDRPVRGASDRGRPSTRSGRVDRRSPTTRMPNSSPPRRATSAPGGAASSEHPTRRP